MTGDPPTWNAWTGCTCGPYWSVTPPPPCQLHPWPAATTTTYPPVKVMTIPTKTVLDDESIEKIVRGVAAALRVPA